MSQDIFIEETVSTADRIFPLETRGREGMRAFLQEQFYWAEKIHTLGKKAFRRSLQEQVLDSIHMLAFASSAGTGLEADKEGSKSDCGEEDRDLMMKTVKGSPAEEHRIWEGVRVADIGTGFGFPGMIWKIAVPSMAITLFERKEKAAVFLERLGAKLRLEGMKVECSDAGLYSREIKFDLAVSKAAGKLSTILPLAERLLSRNGSYVTIKSGNWRWELQEAEGALLGIVESRQAPGNRGELLLFKRKA